MLFRIATTVAILASNVAAEAQPYKLMMGPVLGMSLARRDTTGYQPDQSVCGTGNTCAEACGTGYETCASDDTNTHCYDPTAGQSCCTDGSGNSCDENYYCTHDTAYNTWCCPDSMGLVACAAHFTVSSLYTDAPATSSVAPTTSSVATTTKAETTPTEVSTTEVESSTTPEPKTTSTSIVTKPDVVETEVDEYTTTVCPTPSAGYTTAWSGSNSTVTSAAPTQPYETPAASGSSTTAAPSEATGAAAVKSASALLLAAAGLFALL